MPNDLLQAQQPPEVLPYIQMQSCSSTVRFSEWQRAQQLDSHPECLGETRPLLSSQGEDLAVSLPNINFSGLQEKNKALQGKKQSC